MIQIFKYKNLPTFPVIALLAFTFALRQEKARASISLPDASERTSPTAPAIAQSAG